MREFESEEWSQKSKSPLLPKSGRNGAPCSLIRVISFALQQGLDFPFEGGGVGGADVFFLDAAFAIEEEGDGQSQNASVFLADFGVAHDDRVVHFELLVETGDGVGSVVHGDADDLESLIAILVLETDEERRFYATRLAPCRPEVEEHDLSAIVGELERRAGKLRESEVGGEGVLCDARVRGWFAVAIDRVGSYDRNQN